MSNNATLKKRLTDAAMLEPRITLYDEAYARIAELEAALGICRTDIEALMRSADSLEARNTELEAELSLDGNARVAAYATGRENKCAARIAELEAANAVCRRDIEGLMLSCDKLETGNAWLEAERDRLQTESAEYYAMNVASRTERDRLKAALTAEREAACQFMDATTRNLYLKSRTTLSDPSGE
jgi:chromosome segregation ATPase